MRPFVMTIAGHDPSGGAGLTSDCKTFEQLKVQGLTVCTAVTVQTEDQFHSVNWVNNNLVLEQVDTLIQRYHPGVVKIGLIQSATLLQQIIQQLQKQLNNTFIIWDPILSSSSGFYFHNDIQDFESTLVAVSLLTPNRIEAEKLFGSNDARFIQDRCRDMHLQAVLLKGGHSIRNKGDDLLITCNDIINIKGEQQHLVSDKHGTGCILSAAIAAELAKGNNLVQSCITGKRYVERIMSSNKSLLGFHS